MKIEREDVVRMKELARKVANETNAVAIHELEHGFIDYMTTKYGRKKAVEMLTKVWKLSAMIKILPGDIELVEGEK